MTESYSRHELDDRFTALQDSFEVRLDSQGMQLDRIEKQTTKTNGRVTLLEKFMWGSLGALPFITAGTGWLAVDYLQHRNEVPTAAIQAAVEAGLSKSILDHGN